MLWYAERAKIGIGIDARVIERILVARLAVLLRQRHRVSDCQAPWRGLAIILVELDVRLIEIGVHPVGTDQEVVVEAGRLERPRLAGAGFVVAAGNEERAVRTAIAEQPDEAVAADDVGIADLGMELAEAAAHPDTELIGPGYLEIVVEQIDLAVTGRRAGRQHVAACL